MFYVLNFTDIFFFKNQDTYQKSNSKHGVVFFTSGQGRLQLSIFNDANMAATFLNGLDVDKLSALGQLELGLHAMYRTCRL